MTRLKHYFFQFISLKNKMRWLRAEIRWMRCKRFVRERLFGSTRKGSGVGDVI